MVKILAGKMGSGKTKRMIEMANEAQKNAKGSIFFIDDDNRNIFELESRIRFINIEDLVLDNEDLLYGFICGLVNSDYDMEHLYIDGLDFLSEMDNQSLDQFIKKLQKLTESNDIQLILCFNREENEMSQTVKELLI